MHAEFENCRASDLVMLNVEIGSAQMIVAHDNILYMRLRGRLKVGLTQLALAVISNRPLVLGQRNALIGSPYTGNALLILYADNRAEDVWLKTIRQPLAASFGNNMQATLVHIMQLCRVSVLDPLLRIDEGCSHIYALKVKPNWPHSYACNCCWMQLYLCPGGMLTRMG